MLVVEKKNALREQDGALTADIISSLDQLIFQIASDEYSTLENFKHQPLNTLHRRSSTNNSGGAKCIRRINNAERTNFNTSCVSCCFVFSPFRLLQPGVMVQQNTIGIFEVAAPPGPLGITFAPALVQGSSVTGGEVGEQEEPEQVLYMHV